MVKKILLSGLLFCSVVMFVGAQEVVFTFEPLKPNERLAFKTTDRQGWLLSLYAQDIETQAVTRFINAWDDSTRRPFQFANDNRDCFFVVEYGKRAGHERGSGGEIYKVKGEAGVVIRLLDDIRVSGCHASVDGNFILYAHYAYGKSECVFSLYDGETGDLIHQFSWIVKRAQGGYHVTRNDDGSFTLVLIGEAGYLYAEAVFSPVTLELKLLWDKSADENYKPSGRRYSVKPEVPLGDTIVIDPTIEEIAVARRISAMTGISVTSSADFMPLVVIDEPELQPPIVESPPPAVVTKPEPALEPEEPALEAEQSSGFPLPLVFAGLGTVLLVVIIAVIVAKRMKKAIY